MDAETVRKHINKRVLITTKQGSKYTLTIPYFPGKSFTTKDKFNEDVSIDCEEIATIQQPRGEQQ